MPEIGADLESSIGKKFLQFNGYHNGKYTAKRSQ